MGYYCEPVVYSNLNFRVNMKNWGFETIKYYFIRYFPFVVVFIGSLYNPSDADLGWHLKYGEYFFQNGTILKENIFSTMMAGYHWINSSWATDLITYTVFRNFGFFGLTVLGALVVTATFYFFSRAFKLGFWEQACLFPLLMNFEQLVFLISFRGQLLTFLFFGILFYFLIKFAEGHKKLLFGVVPLFILWSNLHGEFILGLAIFAVWIFFYLIGLIRQCGKIVGIKLPIFILFLSSLAVLINPFGIDVYLETIRHFGNPLQKYIVEWLPFDTFTEPWWKLIIWGILMLSGVFILIRKKELVKNLHYVGPAIILYILSFWMRRYNWPMFFISIPVVKIIFSQLKIRMNKIQYIGPTIIFILLYFYFLYFRNPTLGIAGMNWNRYCQRYLLCSPQSVEFLVQNKPSGKMLTFYNWGGYLIWNYPQIKPSIDGRMHLWRDEKGYSAFAEYYSYEQNWADIDKSDYDVVLIDTVKPLYSQMISHVEKGTWKIAYRDDYAAIFVRNKTAFL